MPVEARAGEAVDNFTLFNDECLVPVQPQGSAPPLFVTHGMQCDPTFARMLPKYLGQQQPLFGFQGLGLDGDSEPLDRIEAMATRFIEPLRRVQPRGPYRLAGFCAGGHIAMEMAHQLAAAGESVDHLFLIDTPATADPENLEAAIAEAVATARQRLQVSPQRRRHLAGAPAVVAGFGEALRAYRRKPYAGRVHILASQERLERMRHPELGWQKFVPAGTVVWIIAPTHEAITREGMPPLARHLRENLQQTAPIAPTG